ncbi:MAG: hypothetical protein ACEPOV_09340 [Hyphomicrobiales bacterium]
MKRLLHYVSLLTLCLFIFLAFASNQENEGISDEKTGKVENANFDLAVSSIELIRKYDENELAADREYKDKILEVTGTLEKVDRGIGNYYLILEGDKYSYTGVQCFFDKENGLADLKAGQEVTVIGYCNGIVLNIHLKDCILKKQA